MAGETPERIDQLRRDILRYALDFTAEHTYAPSTTAVAEHFSLRVFEVRPHMGYWKRHGSWPQGEDDVPEVQKVKFPASERQKWLYAQALVRANYPKRYQR